MKEIKIVEDGRKRKKFRLTPSKIAFESIARNRLFEIRRGQTTRHKLFKI
jgi:hypothetical protein